MIFQGVHIVLPKTGPVPCNGLMTAAGNDTCAYREVQHRLHRLGWRYFIEFDAWFSPDMVARVRSGEPSREVVMQEEKP